jgi:hypothetical protein
VVFGITRIYNNIGRRLLQTACRCILPVYCDHSTSNDTFLQQIVLYCENTHQTQEISPSGVNILKKMLNHHVVSDKYERIYYYSKRQVLAHDIL